MPGTILLGIDVETASENSVGYAKYGAEMYNNLNVPVTFFLTGQTLERYPDAFKPLEKEPLIDLQSHTYSHILLKTVLIEIPKGRVVHGKTGWFMAQGGSNEAIEADIAKCQQVFLDVLGRRSTAMTTPWAYYRGLGDRPDLLEILHRHGFHAVRSFGRDEHDGQPVPLEWQPYFYAPQDYPDFLETLVHGYQDDFYWEQFARNSPEDKYSDCLRTMARRVARENLVWSMASHDHGCATKEGFEHKGEWLRNLIDYARELNIRFLTISQFYEEMLAKRG